jgi:hypothetical protein
MDFNKIVNMMREIEPTDIANPNADAPKADTKPAVVLSESAQLRVKAGISTVLAESKKIQEGKVKDMLMDVEEGMGKAEFEKKYPGQDYAKIKQEIKDKMDEGKMPEKAIKALKAKNKDSKKSKKTDDDQTESIKVKSKKFDEEVEDILKAAESKLVKEAKKKMPMDDNGTPNDKSDDKPAFLKGKKDTSKKDADSKDDKPAKGLSAKQKKLPKGLQNAIAKKKGKTESVVTTKKAVAESMSFLDAIKIVKESNGEMKVNAVDTAIWNWAKRVAASKVTEGGIKQEAYAAKVYESKGGVWDVTRTVISE